VDSITSNLGGKMKVGDLVRPKREGYFKEMGYAIITKYDSGDVVFVWLYDHTDVFMKWWEFEEWMEAA
jgi:hypothetical protein